MSKPDYDINKYIYKYVRNGGISIIFQSDEPLADLKSGAKYSYINAVFAEAANNGQHEVSLVPSSSRGLIYFGPEFDVGQVQVGNGGKGLSVVDDGRISANCDFSGDYRLASVYAPDNLAQTEEHARLVRKLGNKIVCNPAYL